MVYPEIRAICEMFGMQSEISISEGTLILAVKEKHWQAFSKHMAARNTPITEIGRFMKASDGIMVIRGGKREPLKHPRVDPFWSAFDRAMKG
ncbi:hypothetical protein CEE36_06940 [candidate division TA06 bacterium B3_TA06]|uniref:PurM-like C-terminal domain-containing protein n=1 Tax=candidate division TA06 bacterium B3_TA06 TaxID=2012487 RepID=A0A532V607_UNCT6|nr:MAG: hypothetical protein CEE36_06940 [candidate division TA06 bacterium B3_TA06]